MLTKQVNKPTFDNPNELISLNKKFSNAQRKITIALAGGLSSNQAQSKPEEDRAMVQAIMRERNYKIQAGLVRVMKARLRMPYQELIAEVVDHIKTFTAQPPQIKA